MVQNVPFSGYQLTELDLIICSILDGYLTFFCFPVTLPPRNDTRPDVFVFGPEVGDQMLPTVDDGSSPEIVLNTSFVFFGYSYTRLYVSNFLFQILNLACVFLCLPSKGIILTMYHKFVG